MRPLDGIKILEMAQLVAGPSATQALAQLGAEVVKIEPPGGERGRTISSSPSALYRCWNNSKTVREIDIEHDTGRAELLELAAAADVVIDGYRVGALERHGVGYKQVLERNSDVIWVSISGYPEDSPRATFPAVDAIIQAESGMVSVTGLEQMPLKAGFQAVDVPGGFVVGQAVLAALLQRYRTGEGSYISTSLYDVALHIQGHLIGKAFTTGTDPERYGNAVPYAYPTDVFETASGSLMVAAYFESHWAQFCKIIARPELIEDDRFLTNDLRCAHIPELRHEINATLASKSAEEWYPMFAEAGLMAGRVRSYIEILDELSEGPTGIFTFVRGRTEDDHDDRKSAPYLAMEAPYRSSSWEMVELTAPTHEP